MYLFEFLLGFTFAGRVVVGLCFVMEFNMPRWYDIVVFWYLMSESINTILYTAWYQFVDRGWFLLQFLMLLLTIFVAVYFGVLVPESPKWKYSQKMYTHARAILVYVAVFNSIPDQKTERISKSKFDIEILSETELDQLQLE